MIKTPVTSAPALSSNAAETAESTPPDNPTNIFLPFRFFIVLEYVQKLADARNITQLGRFAGAELVEDWMRCKLGVVIVDDGM